MEWFEVSDTFDACLDAIEAFLAKEWSDGLPVVPPTEKRIAAALEALAPHLPDEVVGMVPPRGGRVTVRDVAVHAVLAGCRPEYAPVVLAALRAVLRPRFNLLGVQATTHGVAPLIVVGGPVVEQIGVNSGTNVFGEGFRANATIGRALRLLLLNAGGGRPEAGDKATIGHPGKYTFCIGENAAALGTWAPLHHTLGVEAANGVTVFGCEAPHSVLAHGGAADILEAMASALATLAGNPTWYAGQVLVVFGAEHAAAIHREGWSRRDVQMFLHERARVPLAALTRSGERLDNPARWPRWVTAAGAMDPGYRMPVMREPDDVLVTTAGGQGAFSAVLPGWGYMGGFAVAEPIDPAPDAGKPR